MRVLDAFTSGGAQVTESRRARELEFATDIDYVHGNHAVRAGLLIERARFRSTRRRTIWEPIPLQSRCFRGGTTGEPHAAHR